MGQMQEILDHWGGLLRATGGALVPKKSYWYAINFKWTGSCWKYRTIADMPGNILITGADGERVVLTRYNPDVAKETLGVMQAMDGNNKAEILHLRGKAEEFADALRTGFLKKNDAWYALTATILKTIEYPMAATTLAEHEWDHIMVPILKAGLPRSGIERNFPRDILYGPKSLQGLGILHPWYHQEIVHLLVCLKQPTIGGITGRQISASTEQMRLEAGLSGWFTDHDFATHESLITDSWIKTVWKFADRFQIKIHDSEAQLSLLRANDQFLMDAFVRAGFRGADLLQLNICRMFLHAVTLSDIATVSGSEITLSDWEGHAPNKVSAYSWPRVQKKLPNTYWKVWQRGLRKCFLQRGSTRAIQTSLGTWLSPPPHWKWFYSPREDRIYKKESLLWLVFPRHRTRTSPRIGLAKYRRSPVTARTPPEDLIYASVDSRGDVIIKVATSHIPASPQLYHTNNHLMPSEATDRKDSPGPSLKSPWTTMLGSWPLR